MWGKSLLSATLALGCATTAPAPPPGPTAAGGHIAPPLRIVEATFGRDNSKRSEPMLVPFGLNQSGTELVMVLLENARKAGAAFVGDLQLVVTFKWNGTAVECRSNVVFAGDPSLAARPEPPAPSGAKATYGTDVEGFKPTRVSVTAHETDLVCHEGVVMHVTEYSSLPDRMDVAEKNLSDGDTRSVQRIERQVTPEAVDTCERKVFDRKAERYDYEVKLGFVPPDWDYISKRYADRQLIAGPPACYQIADVKEPVYRLTATAYYRGASVTMAPSAPPIVGLREGVAVPEGAKSADADRQRCVAAGGKSSANPKDDPCSKLRGNWYESGEGGERPRWQW